MQQQKMINKSKRGPEESEPQYHSQVKSERSQNLFDLDLDCIEDNLWQGRLIFQKAIP